MAWGPIFGAIVGLLQGGQKIEAETERLGKINLANAAGFSATKDSLRFLEDVNAKDAREAQIEAIRAGAAAKREAVVEAKVAEGKAIAQQEGITAGSSKARILSTLYTTEGKVFAGIDEKTRQQVVGIQDQLEQVNNQLESQISDSFNKMVMGIMTGTVAQYDASTALQMGLQGASYGRSLENSFNDLTATNTTQQGTSTESIVSYG